MLSEEGTQALDDYIARYSTTFQNISKPCVLLDPEFNVVYMNDAFLNLTGYTREELIHCDWAEKFVPEERRTKVKNVQLLIQSGLVDIRYEESEILSKDGEKLLLGWNYTLVKDKNGNFFAFSCIGKDISPKVVQTISGSRKDSPNNTDPSPNIDVSCPQYPHTITDSPRGGNVIGNYVAIKTIKGGETGYVQLAVHKDTKEAVAVKTLKKQLMTPEEQERAKREIKIMKHLTALNNPHIVKLIDAQETDAHFHLMVEYLSGGELMNYIKQQKGLSEQESQRLFKHLLSAIECCHDQKIIHRDIKLQNILLDSNNNLKLIDFGLSNFINKGVFRNTFCGTPAYAAPEILLGTQYEGPEVDMWSLGIVLYVMLMTEFPFNTIGDIIKGTFKDPTASEDLLHKLLVTEKTKRATLREVLSHPWLSKCWETSPIQDCEENHSPQESTSPLDSDATSPEGSTGSPEYLSDSSQHSTDSSMEPSKRSLDSIVADPTEQPTKRHKLMQE